MTEDQKPKAKRKLMSVRPPPGMSPVEFIAARREDRAIDNTVEDALNEAARTGEWFGDYESGLDKDDAAFGPSPALPIGFHDRLREFQERRRAGGPERKG